MLAGGRAALLPGLALMAAGLAHFQRPPLDASYAIDLFPAMLLLGLGAGLSFPALMTLAMSGATPEDSRLASGLISTTEHVGGALGLAVLATHSTNRTESLLAQSDRPRPPSPTATGWPSLSPRETLLAALALAAAALRPAPVPMTVPWPRRRPKAPHSCSRRPHSRLRRAC